MGRTISEDWTGVYALARLRMPLRLVALRLVAHVALGARFYQLFAVFRILPPVQKSESAR